MENTLDPKDKDLYRVVSEVLHYVWDPIGIAGVPQARDEYDCYVAQVFCLVHSDVPETELSSHLANIAAERMGLDNSQQRSNDAASALVDWRDFLHEQRP